MKVTFLSIFLMLFGGVFCFSQGKGTIVKTVLGTTGKNVETAVTKKVLQETENVAIRSARKGVGATISVPVIYPSAFFPSSHLTPLSPINVKPISLKGITLDVSSYNGVTTLTPTKNQIFRQQVEEYKNSILERYMLPNKYRAGYFAKRIERYLPRPLDYYGMGEENPEKLYRGMLITPDELETILEKGFSPKDSHWNAGTDGRPAVSFSSKMTEALHYVYQAEDKANAIGVIFEVKKGPQYVLGTNEKLNSTKTIFYGYEDIPSSEIEEVYIVQGGGWIQLSTVVKDIQERRPFSREWTKDFDDYMDRFF